MKNTNKNTSKKVRKFNPLYVIDFTGITSVEDAETRIALAKYEANTDLNYANIQALENYAKSLCMSYAISELIKADRLFVLGAGVAFATEHLDDQIAKMDVRIKREKPNIFKRFWNWITRKK